MEKEKRKIQMMRLRARGYTLAEIGNKYKISRARVHQIIGKTKRGTQ